MTHCGPSEAPANSSSRYGKSLELHLLGPHGAVAHDVMIRRAWLQMLEHDVRQQRGQIAAFEGVPDGGGGQINPRRD